MNDLISRQAAIDESFEVDTKEYGRIEVVGVDAIDSLPSVNPQPKTGRWIVDVDRWGDTVTTVNGYRCSECNAFNTDKDNYCPNCGAKMESREKE